MDNAGWQKGEIKIMTESKDNQKKTEFTSKYSQEKSTKESEKSVEKKSEKTRLKFKKEDMYEIKYNF